MSLVELMVGMLIGLIGIIIITHLYLTNETYKRRTTASGAAQSNGAIALFAVERDLRMAAFGLNHSKAFACNCDQVTNPGCSHIQYYYGGTYSFPPAASAVGARNSLALYPVVITDSVNGPDSVSIFYGSDNERILGSQLAFGMTTPNDDVKIDGTAGFEVGNLLVLQNGTTCSMVQVTSITADALKHAGNGTWNPAGGGTLPGAVYSNTSMIFNLGSTPNWRAYSISNGRLQLTDQFRVLTQGAVSEDIMDGIVDLQAQYGKDTTLPVPDGVVDVWTKCITSTCAGNPTEADWIGVIAVRVAVLARSEEWIKPDNPGDPCSATTAANQPTWAGGNFPTLQAPGVLPSCYKYRSFETVVPLRNMLWRPA
jgi:type IV pilus assembly protein PilW